MGHVLHIGDRVHAGQELAEIEAPELESQVAQAKATVQQTHPSMRMAEYPAIYLFANELTLDGIYKRKRTFPQGLRKLCGFRIDWPSTPNT